MGRLDLFDLFAGLCPRLASLLVLTAMIFSPHLVTHEVVVAGREEARPIIAALESMIPHPEHAPYHSMKQARHPEGVVRR